MITKFDRSFISLISFRSHIFGWSPLKFVPILVNSAAQDYVKLVLKELSWSVFEVEVNNFGHLKFGVPYNRVKVKCIYFSNLSTLTPSTPIHSLKSFYKTVPVATKSYQKNLYNTSRNDANQNVTINQTNQVKNQKRISCKDPKQES